MISMMMMDDDIDNDVDDDIDNNDVDDSKCDKSSNYN
jgi:hypothetical protein